nr:hypothetical protein [Tanacetum cinerariifolium]
MTKAKDQRSQSMKEQAYNVDRDKEHKSLTTTAISMNSQKSVIMNSLRGRLAAASVSAARHVNTATSRPNVNSALPITYSYFKAHSPVRRPFNQKSAAKTYNFDEKVNTAKVNNVTTAGPKAVVGAAEGNWNNAVKSSACWIWRPKGNLIDHISKDSGSYTLKKFKYVDPQGRLKSDQEIFNSGCSRHMTGNKSYLTDYQDIDGGFVAFGGNAKGGGLTCLFAKATLDESNLWHKRLGYINFKTMNKLVKKNLVRGLPSKLFENDHTCVACQKGKQHKASCIENKMDHKVITIRSDNRTEFKNRIMNEFYEIKGIRREFSVARTPQQNGAAEKKIRTLVDAAKTMLADSKFPTTV